jgi:putative oxidoreductase
MKIRNLLFNTNRYAPDLAILILRLGAGFFLARWGWDKWISFDEKAVDWPDPLHVGHFTSLALTVFAELVCSILVMAGFLTRPALAVLLVTMLLIIFVIHAGHPLSEREHAFSFLIPFLAVFLLGPGRFSIDTLIKK